jgi:hypothetical protein
MNRNQFSTFGRKPAAKVAWWALWLSIISLLVVPSLGAVNTILRPLLDPASGNPGGPRGFIPMGFVSGVLSFILAVSALVAGIRAYKMGERSWVVWVGLVLAIIVSLFWTFMFVGGILFPY